ncbi:MAG: methyltransferase domain-containing protein [Acidobacteria bacterium]|nr:methyltransferase domain-containing protein [Acidobacteriota bacterium]
MGSSGEIIDRKQHDIAAAANAATYDEVLTRTCTELSPHIKHPTLKRLYENLIADLYQRAAENSSVPAVLDIGAGEGSVTLPFLEFGCRVTAVDLSTSQIAELEKKCSRYADRLETRCMDVTEFLETTAERFDLIVANSFLHHVPDYVGLVEKALMLLRPGGQFFSFQDPMRYDTLPPVTRIYSGAAYIGWRLFDGDVIRGIGRYIRRKRGVYLDDSPEDNTEFHATRNGVDQNAIAEMLRKQGFEVEIVPYFSTHSPFFQKLGETLNVADSFGIVARRTDR